MYNSLPDISPQTFKAKTLREIAPPNIIYCTWKIALKYKVKQREKGKFPSNYNASPIDFETQISLLR